MWDMEQLKGEIFCKITSYRYLVRVPYYMISSRVDMHYENRYLVKEENGIELSGDRVFTTPQDHKAAVESKTNQRDRSIHPSRSGGLGVYARTLDTSEKKKAIRSRLGLTVEP